MIAAPPYALRLTKLRDGLCLGITGELDMSNAPDLAAAFQRIADDEPQWVAVDVGEVTFIDVAAARALIAGAESGRGRYAYEIVRAGGIVATVIEALGARGLLRVSDSPPTLT